MAGRHLARLDHAGLYRAGLGHAWQVHGGRVLVEVVVGIVGNGAGLVDERRRENDGASLRARCSRRRPNRGHAEVDPQLLVFLLPAPFRHCHCTQTHTQKGVEARPRRVRWSWTLTRTRDITRAERWSWILKRTQDSSRAGRWSWTLKRTQDRSRAGK